MRILVVEDEKKVAKALRDGLERKPSALQSLRDCNETLHDIDLLRASSGLLTVMSQMATGT